MVSVFNAAMNVVNHCAHSLTEKTDKNETIEYCDQRLRCTVYEIFK